MTETSTVPLAAQADGLEVGKLMADLVRSATMRGSARA
jgi:hypothetical protein